MNLIIYISQIFDPSMKKKKKKKKTPFDPDALVPTDTAPTPAAPQESVAPVESTPDVPETTTETTLDGRYYA